MSVPASECVLTLITRYMQILSDDLCRRWSGRIINIHHSFLPSFKGAKPYHQAFERGVKLVGATARTTSRPTSTSRDVEAQVLSRAVRWHAESRVLLNGRRTVAFR